MCVSVSLSVCEHVCLSVRRCLHACLYASLTASWIVSPFQDCDFALVPVESWKHQVSAFSVDSFSSPPPIFLAPGVRGLALPALPLASSGASFGSL